MFQIKYITPDLLLDENVAVVGSSLRLLKTEYGDLIDNFNEIIRFNRAPTQGYEKFVGSKETVRTSNNHVFQNVDISDWALNQPRYFIKNLKDQRILFLGPDLGPWHNREHHTDPSSMLYCFQYDMMNALKAEVGYNGIKPLSVGLTVISLLVVSHIVPSVFGFDSNDSDERSHYFEEIGPSGNVHNRDGEKMFLKTLAEEGKITLYD